MSVPGLECEIKRRKCPERDIPRSALRLMWCVRSISRTRTGLGAPWNDELSGVLALSCKSNFSTAVGQMKPSTKNEIAGKVHEVKGKIKEMAGQMTNEQDLEDQGIAEKTVGKVQNKAGHAEKAIGK